ncbi:MAG: hypothetical protein ACK58L_21155 [Planctomycetota bacterium]
MLWTRLIFLQGVTRQEASTCVDGNWCNSRNIASDDSAKVLHGFLMAGSTCLQLATILLVWGRQWLNDDKPALPDLICFLNPVVPGGKELLGIVISACPRKS